LSPAPTKRLQPAAPAPALLVAEELEIVERRLAGLLRSREDTLSEISRYLIGSGGKRVRPAVTLLVFRACGGEDLRDIVDVAVALELIHSASLLHDDIIDGSSARRGRDSALLKYGVANTLVAGDFLFSRAFQICGRFDERLIHWAAEACIRLTEGEVMQGRFRRNPAVTLDDYLEIIDRKTASLFETGARTAAHLASARDETVESMARCGRHVGLAFQMIDDLLDVTGAESKLGKPVGIDIREGNPSLPIVLGLGDGEVRRLFAKPELEAPEIETLLGRVRRSPELATARRLALEHAEIARTELDSLPDSTYRESLLALTEQLVERVS
jgi:octaprenyl-diphosphate synthase